MATNRKKTIKEMEAEWDRTHENEGKKARNTGKTIKEMEAEWDRGSTQRNAIFAANDYNTLSTNIPGHIKSYTDSRYQLGGSAAIKNSGVISEFATYDKYVPIISRNFAAGKDYLGLTDDEVAEYQAYMQQMAKDSVWGGKLASARTGGLDAIDMSGMPKAQQRELGRMGNLSQRDTVYEKLQQNPDQEYYEHNYGEIFQGMSEKEYLDKLTAYYRNKKNKEAAQKKYDDWKAGADAETAKILSMSEYEADGTYKGGSEYLTPDNAYLEGYDHYTDENGVTLSAKQYREKVVNETLAALVDAGKDPAKLEAMRGNIEMLPELNNNDYNYEALPYMTDEQRGAFFTLYNSGKTDAAKDYLRHTLDYGLRKAYVEDSEKQLKEDLEEANALEKAAYSALTVPINLINEAQGAVLAAKGAVDPEYIKNMHEFDPMFDATRTSQTVRGEVGQDIAEGAKWANIPGTDMNLAQMGYNALMSAGDSALNAFLFGGAGAWAPTTAMGAGAFASELMESQDYWDALAAGIIEGVSEYIPFDIIGSGAIKPAAKVMYNMIAEGLGEGSADIINTAYDVIKNGASSEAGQMVDELITQGYTKKDAILQVIKEKGLDVLESGITGAMSGVSAAPKAISEHRADKKTGTNLANNEGKQVLADLAETLPVSKQAKDIIARMRAEMSERTKGDKTEGEIADTAAVTKENADAAMKAAEMTARNKAEKADAEKGAKAEAGTVDAAAVTKRDANKAVKEQKHKAVKNAEVGYVYREVMRHLDEGAKNIVAKSFARDTLETELAQAGFRGDMRKAANDVAKFISGKADNNTFERIKENSAMRNVALSYMAEIETAQGELYRKAGDLAQRASEDYVKPESTKAEKGAQEVTQGVDDRAAISAEDVLNEDAEDIIEMTDDDIDVEIADADESTVNGRTVTIEGVAKINDDGSVVFNVKDADGNTSMAAADEVTVGRNDSTVARLAEMAKDLGKNAGAMIKNYAEGQSVVQYAKAYKAAMQYGEDGRNLDAIKGYDNLQGLNEAQIEAAYDAGRETRTKRNTMFERTNAAGIKVGQVDTSAINKRTLKANQAATVRSMTNIAKAIGFNVKFVESNANAEGRYTTENGRWDPKTLTLTLDVHAGSNSTTDTNYAMIHTAGHELTHFIKQFADGDMWNAYQEFVVGHLSKKDGAEFNLENEITSRMNAEGLTRDAAIVEVIADASGEALNRISEADIQSLAETNPGLMSKIKQFFKQWIGNLKKMISTAYKGTEAKNEVARQMMDAVDEMGKRWNALLVNAAKNRAENVVSETTNAKTALQIDAETQVKIDNSEAVTADVEIKNSLRMDEQFGAEAKRVNEKNRYVSAKTLMQAIDDRATIKKIFTDPKNLDLLKLPPDIEGDTFVSDSSYGGTEENTTVCIRSMAAQALMDIISQNLGRPLTVQDTLLISQEIAGLTDRPECYYCYVATDRRAYRDFLGQYLKQRNEVIEKYKAGADRKELYDDFRNGRKDTKNMRDRYNMWLDAVDNGTALIDGNDLSSLENLFGEVDNLRSEILAAAAEVSEIDARKLNIVGGNVRYARAGKQITAVTIKALAKKRPDMAERIDRYNQLTDATAYAQSASWAKKMKGYAAYNGHILEWSQKRIDDLNKHYGLRMYSFSDFSPAFILENMQMVTDAAVRGLNMLGYTKEMPFAEIFAPTGMNINISTFAYEQGDEIREDYKQGASWERAKALREKHPNVGIVMVATSDKILEWALQQDWVDVVIPYHLVRTGTEVAKYFGYRNYTDVSADGKGLTFAEKNKGKAKKDKVTSVSPVEHRNDLISYVDALQRHGLTPRFANWLKGLDEYLAEDISPKQFREMNPNYMKLVNETRRSYADTEPVQPRFDVEAAERAIQQMIREGGYYTPVGGSMAEQFEIAGNIADKIRNRDGQIDDGVKYSMRDTQGTVLSPQQAEYFKDSKAVDDEGNLLVLYHGTRAGTQISVFKTTEEYRKGLYLTDIPKVAEGFASKVVGRNDDGSFKYADIKTVTKANFDDYDFETSGVYKMYANIKNPYVVYAGYAYYYNIPTPDEMRSGNYGSTVDTQEINAWAYEHGYDGVIVKNVREGGGDYPGTDVIVFDKNQVKFADNDEPTESDDIRYQKRDLSNLTDRDLLVSALETDLSEAERSHLSKYKEKVEQLNKDQRKLEELNTKIVELRNAGFTPRTSEELRAAETNVATLRGRIDRADAALNQIESAAMIKEVIRRNRKEASKQRAVQLREWQEKEKYKALLERDTKRLYKFLLSPNKDKSVPEFLRKPVADFIAHIDFRSKRMLSGGEPTNRDIDFATALENLRDAIDMLGDQQQNIDNDAEVFFGYIDLPTNYLQNFRDNVKEIKRSLEAGGKYSGTPIEKMSAAQIRELSQAMRILSSSITHIHDFLSEGRGTSAKNLADTTMNELAELKARIKTNKALELLNSTFNWKNTTPYYAFERLGLGGKAMFERLQNGWDKMAFNSAKVIEFSKKTFNAKESKAWSGEITEVTLDSGNTIRMTTAQKMSLYCHTKRAQSRGHLLGDGIRVGNIDGKLGTTIRQVNNYTLTLNDIKKITGSLTARQIEVADALQSFMSTVCADWGNEISMKRFGFKQMTEEFYIPIETDGNNRAKIDESREGGSSMFRLLNMSFLKPLKPKANNAIVIKDIFDVFSDHASDMAKYNAMALPILDFIKWYNHIEKGDNGNVRSMQRTLESAFGDDARNYLTTFVKDLNAEHDGGRNDGLINSIIGRAKGAAVGANLRVYALQVTSLPRAAYAINPVYLAQGAAKLKNLNPVNAIKGTEAQEKIGILKWKDLGFYSTDISRSTRGMIKRNDGIMGKLRDWSMAPAGWGDNWVGSVIYEAVKAEMKAKHPEIKPGTATYDARVNERVREIVYKTQVVDSTMTRSDLMRSKGLASMLTAFMSEPTLTINMLNESIQKAVEIGRKGGNTREILRATSGMAVRAATTFAITAFVTGLLESAFDALRDDDEYETFEQKLADALGGNVLDNLNPITMLPILNEAWSILVEGYEDNSLMTQVLSQGKSFMDAIKSYKKGNTTLYNVIYKGMQTGSSMVGLGVANATRDIASLYNTFLAPAWNTPKWQTYEDSASTAANAYYGALKENRTEDAAYYKRRMEVDGIDQAKVADKVATLIGDDYVAGNITEANARKWFDSETALDDKKIDTKMRDLSFKAETGVNYDDFRKAYLDGRISKTEATRLLKKYRGYDDNEVYFMLDEWAGGEDWTKLGAFLDAVDNQGNYAAEAKKLLDHGVEKDDIAKAIAKAYKEAYREIHGTQAGNLMLEYLLDVYEAIGYDRADQRKYIARNWFKD